jgi:hypothetical protein
MNENIEPQPIVLHSPSDLVAAIPGLLGFYPSDSVVVAALCLGRVEVLARFDIDLAADEPLLIDRMKPLTRSGDSYIGVVFSPDRGLARIAVQILGKVLEPLLGVFIDGGPPPDSPQRAQLAATVAGPSAADQRDAVVELAALRAEVNGWQLGRRQAAATALVAAGLNGEDLSIRDLWELAVLVQSGQVRDVVWPSLRPDNADDHLALWLAVLEQTPDDLAPSVLAMAGCAAWQQGDGALLNCCLERGLAIDPDHSMLRCLEQVSLRGLPPSVWQPIIAASEHSELEAVG